MKPVDPVDRDGVVGKELLPEKRTNGEHKATGQKNRGRGGGFPLCGRHSRSTGHSGSGRPLTRCWIVLPVSGRR